MRFKSLLNNRWLPVLAFAVLAIFPYGCSKSEEAKDAATVAKSETPADPGKEHFEKGVRALLQKQNDEAIKEFNETIKINPKSSEAYNNIGFAYLDKEDVEKSIESQKKAIELNPQLANGYYGLAMAYEKKGDNEGALNNWKEFAKLSEPHSKWWTKAQERIAVLEGGQQAQPAGH